MKKNKNSIIEIFIFILLIGSLSVIFAQTYGSSGNVSITIWDETDSLERLTYCGEYCSYKLKNANQWDVDFYANFTNLSGEIINSSLGDCKIRFNETGTWNTWQNMNYNETSLLWEYNRSFNYKGTLKFETNCTSSIDNITESDDISITNTPPYILETASGYIDINNDLTRNDILQCTEDIPCSYNFSANVSEDDYNDILTYGFSSTGNTTLTNFTINSSTGILDINITNSLYTGSKKIELTVRDTESSLDYGILEVNITNVNDAPQFVNLENQTFNMTELFEYNVNITDEENDVPFILNITFLSCSTAEWSTRNNTNCELFNESDYTFNETTGVLDMSFTPSRNDVGTYIMNFSVMDNSSYGNKTTSEVINFTVNNINSAPYFTYVCDNERNGTEDSEFFCTINATDIDEVNNLTFNANYTWLTFNGTNNNTISIDVNSTTSFNGTTYLNFTPTDLNVGNWSVNISVTDTGSSAKTNSTQIYLFIDNINDSVLLDNIPDMNAYTSNNYTIYVNASDNDLLIPDKSVYNEDLSFSVNNSNLSIISETPIAGTNITTIAISFNPNDLGAGNHTINVSVNDSNLYSSDSKTFNIQVIGNTAPVWDALTETNFILTEDSAFYLNLSQNVTDVDADSLNFSSLSNNDFPSFSLNPTTGIISFTPVDEDIGEHIVTITVTDGIASVPLEFNFTVNNINDNPSIIEPLSVSNATIDANSNINAVEGNYTTITLIINDDDLRIPEIQTNFYNESLNINLTIEGVNSSLFNFQLQTITRNNGRAIYEATFTPNQSDIGDYNITINVTDANNFSDVLTFNLSISNVEDNPTITEISNLNSSVIESVYIDINATDQEDGDETSGNLTYSYNFLNGTDFINGNESIFNTTSGELNITFNLSQGGQYSINFSVNDTTGLYDSFIWNLSVYDYPQILFPLDYEFSFKENVTSIMNFSVNHSVQDDLNYTLIINGIVKNTTIGNGNATNFYWNFTPNFTDETTCSGIINLTLNVSNEKLSNSTSWNLTVNHTNYPLEFTSNIPDTTLKILTLSNYFNDIDATDACRNQTVGFSYNLLNSSGGAITVSIINWTNGTIPTISFSSTSSGKANYSITAYEYNTTNNSIILSNVTSNNFSVELTVTDVIVPTPTPSSSTSTRDVPVSLKIIVPEPISTVQNEKIIVPISLVNNGEKRLSGINLSAIVAQNNSINDEIMLSFSESYIDYLNVKEEKNLTLTINTNTNETGLFEITVNADVKSPKYNDWGKFFLTIQETEVIKEKIIFAQEFLENNPECIELEEVLDEARAYFEKGDFANTIIKINMAIDGCKNAISQQARAKRREPVEDPLYRYLIIATMIVFFVGIIFYSYKRIKLKRTIFRATELRNKNMNKTFEL